MESHLLEQRYTNLLSRYSGPGKKVITSYHGQMDHDRISMLTYTSEHQLDNEGARRGTIKKIFNILIEMLQNIHLHGAISDKMGNPFSLILAQSMDEYELTCTNIVGSETAKKITKSLEAIKKMSERDLKSHYMEVLSNEQYSLQGGAGLGLITIALKCHNHFTYDNIPINDQITLFSITAIITDK